LGQSLRTDATIEDFRATPSTIFRGQTVTLSWVTHSTTNVRIEPIAYASRFLSGSITVAPRETTTYTLIAYDGAEPFTKSVVVDVRETECLRPPGPATIEVDCNGVCVKGEVAQLTARTSEPFGEGCPSQFIWFFEFGGSGFGQTVSHVMTQCGIEHISLHVKNDLGQFDTSTTINIECGTKIGFIDYFRASPTRIQRGQSTTLSWNTVGVAGVTILPDVGDRKPSDSVTVTPAQTTTYTITAFGGPSLLYGTPVTVIVDPVRRRGAGH